jgi:uncharacterized phiE125 gp8 family phage protein
VIFTLERMSGPAFEAVTLEEARRHLREFDGVTERDVDIEALITGAREWVENFTGRTLVDTQWSLILSAGPTAEPTAANSEVLLRRSPVLEVIRVVTVDSAGTETEVDTTTYELRDQNSRWPRLVGLSGASTAAGGTLRVKFRSGFVDTTDSNATAAAVPQRFKTAMLLWIQANYDPDDQMDRILDTAERLIRPECADFGFA